MDFYTLRRYQDVLGAGRSTPKGISLPSQVEDLKAFLESDAMILLLDFKDHMRRFAVDVIDPLATSKQTPFGVNNCGDMDEEGGESALTANAIPRYTTPPPRKRSNPYILYSPSKNSKR
ncbi:hypothetical protein BGW42_007682, partial [Actinomortierella wolfii]